MLLVFGRMMLLRIGSFWWIFGKRWIMCFSMIWEDMLLWQITAVGVLISGLLGKDGIMMRRAYFLIEHRVDKKAKKQHFVPKKWFYLSAVGRIFPWVYVHNNEGPKIQRVSTLCYLKNFKIFGQWRRGGGGSCTPSSPPLPYGTINHAFLDPPLVAKHQRPRFRLWLHSIRTVHSP